MAVMRSGTEPNTPRRMALSVRFPEPPLDGVEPGARCGREMQLEAGMLGQPGNDVGVAVGPVVVQDEVNVKSFGNFAIDAAQEPQKLGVAMLRQALAGGYAALASHSNPGRKPRHGQAGGSRRVGGRGRPIGLCRGAGTPPPTGRLPQPIDFRTVAKLLTGSTYRWSSKLTLLLLVTRPKRTPVLLDGTRGLHRARSTRKLYSSSPGPSSPAGVNASPGAGTAIVQCN
jgi:hypothetical protein